MKVLIADKLSEQGKRILADRGLSYDEKTGLAENDLAACIGDYDAVLVRSATKVTRRVLEQPGRLRAIGRAGVGVDNVDLEAATQKGIVVMNTPDANTISTAEHTFSLVLALSRNVPQACSSLKSGQWERSKFAGVELSGKTIGIIGLGRIGARVARYAQAFGMTVLAHDPFVTAERAEQLSVQLVEMDALLAQADYVTVHVPLMPETKKMLDRAALQKMKRGVRVINCARGGLIDEEALAEALESGHVAGAALDVFEQEPPADARLLGLPNVVVTPHLGASTREAQDGVATDIALQMADFLLDGRVQNALNMPSTDPKLFEVLRPYITLAEKLGSFAAQVIQGSIVSFHVVYRGQVQEHDVAPLTLAALKGFLERVLAGGVNYVNAPVLARQRGIKVVESRDAQVEDFASLIRIETQTEKETFAVAGTLFGVRPDPRIVRINDYHVDAHPSGVLILLQNKDRPGAIGKIGMTLGKHGVNIADMTLGRSRIAGDAVVVLNIDGNVPDAAMAELRALDEVVWAKAIEL